MNANSKIERTFQEPASKESLSEPVIKETFRKIVRKETMPEHGVGPDEMFRPNQKINSRKKKLGQKMEKNCPGNGSDVNNNKESADQLCFQVKVISSRNTLYSMCNEFFFSQNISSSTKKMYK